MAIISKPVKLAEEWRGVTMPVVTIGVVMALLYWGRMFFITAVIAVIIAFILEPFVGLLIRIRFPRSVASFVVCALALFLLYLAGLGAYTQISGLLDELPVFSQRIGDAVDQMRSRFESLEARTYDLVVPKRQKQQQPPPPVVSRRRRSAAPAQAPVLPAAPGTIPEVRIHRDNRPVIDYIYARLGSFYQIALMASFIPFLVYFMLSWRDHVHRSFLQFFRGEDRLIAARSLQGIGDMVRAFVVGNFVLGMLLAVLSSLAFWMVHLPYPLLAGPLSGFFSLVPYVGLPLAVLPPMFVALAAPNPVPLFLIVAVIVVFLHLLAMNVFYPKLVGSRVHLNPLVVTFALMLWGFLWDAAGLVLAIPLTAALKAVCDNVRGLRPYGKFLGD